MNIFYCGGIAIGLCISHKIVDGAAISTFLKGWTATACGSQEVVYPNFSAPSLFPANDLWLRDSAIYGYVWCFVQAWQVCYKETCIIDASAIASLKAEATSSYGVKHPSRVEVVSAFIWKSAMAASEEKHGTQRSSLLTHVVNLRKRMPTLSENSLGNLIWMASAKCKAKNRDMGLHGLVYQVHEGISKIDGEFVKELRGDNGATVMSKSMDLRVGVSLDSTTSILGGESPCGSALVLVLPAQCS